jgi:RNA recognition motif-containing protein
MASKNDGIKAISKLNGAEVNGRNIKVNEGQKKPAFSGNQNRRW